MWNFKKLFYSIIILDNSEQMIIPLMHAPSPNLTKFLIKKSVYSAEKNSAEIISGKILEV